MTSITFGVPITGEISVPGEEDTYTLDLAAGDQVYVAVADLVINDGLFTSATVSLNQNTTTIENVENSSILDKKEYQISASEDTTIELSVKDEFDDGTGRYTVFAQRTNNPVGATPINVGEYAAGNLSIVGEEDVYTVEIQPGDKIFLNTSGFGDPSIAPDVELFNSDGILITEGLENLSDN
ncbi:hypothetical protein M595_5996, partial [Lyngbya aestuarii BL J]